MKKTVLLAALAMFLSVFSYKASAQSGLGFEIGLSTPNDQINNVYNNDNFNLNNQDYIGHLWRQGSKLGWNIGVKLRMPVSENFAFAGGLSWNKFPQTTIEVKDSNDNSVLAVLNTTQNIVSVTAGMNYYIFRSFISPFAVGELSYNYISNSVELQQNNSIGIITTNPFGNTSYNRIGFGVGAGIDLDLKIVNLNLTAKYNMANLIGRQGDEKEKTYVTLNLGVFFGGLMPI